MSKLISSWNNIQYFEEEALKKTIIHRLNPLVKLLVTFAFIMTVVSFDKYALSAMLPLFLYPMVMITLSELSIKSLLIRMAFTAPFVIGIGILNPFFDHTPLVTIGTITITGGWISFISILIRFSLTVIAALILIGVSGINGIAKSLLNLNIPRIFVLQLLFMYRYISVLIEETAQIIQAYSLRSKNQKSIQFKVIGSLLGQLLLRSMDRAQRIYHAMICRGFDGEIRAISTSPIGKNDLLFLMFWIGYFFAVRFLHIPNLIGRIFIGG